MDPLRVISMIDIHHITIDITIITNIHSMDQEEEEEMVAAAQWWVDTAIEEVEAEAVEDEAEAVHHQVQVAQAIAIETIGEEEEEAT